MKTILDSNHKVFRLDDIRLYQLLGAAPEASFEDMMRLAIQISQAPIAFISFIDGSGQWLKGQIGIQGEIQPYLDFCNLVMTKELENRNQEGILLSPQPTQINVIRGASTDQIFVNHPLVKTQPQIKFYVGIPIITGEGVVIGILSLMDYIPRQLTQEVIESLKSLCRQMATTVDLRRQLVDLGGKVLRLEDIINERKKIWELVRKERDFFCTVLDTVDALVIVLDPQGKIVRFNNTCEQLTGYSASEVEDSYLWDLFLLPAEVPGFQSLIEEICQHRYKRVSSGINDYESFCIAKDGTRRLIAWSNKAIEKENGKIKYIICTGIDITESRQNELEIRKARQFLDSIVDNIPHAIFVKYAEDLRFASVNKAVEEMVGYSKDAFIGHNDYDFFPKNEADFFTQKDREVLASRTLLDIPEEKIQTQDTGERILHTKKIPIFDEGGNPNYLLGISEDITDRKKAEENLYLLERAIAASSNGIVITDNMQPDNPIIYCNGAFEKITGYSREEVLGKNCRFLQSSDTQQESLALIRQSVKTEKECVVILKNYRKDGTPFWNELAIAPVRDSNSRLTHFIGVQTDITQRREAEEALKTSEERYRLLAETSTDLISRHSPEGIYLYASPASRLLLGYEPEELVGNSLSEFIHIDDSLAVREAHENILKNADIYTVSYRIRRQDGSYIWFETTSHKIHHPETGIITEIVCVSRDITQRKQVEASLVERSRLSTLEAEVGAALGGGGNIVVILQHCTAAMVQHLNASGAAIWTIQTERNELELQAKSGEVDDKCKERKEEFILDSKSPITYPLIVESRQVGLMAICCNETMTDAVKEALGWVANAIAVAIDRVKAREELLSRREGLLFRLASQIRDSLDLDKILGTAVHEIYSLLQVDQCVFLWYLPADPVGCFAITHEAKNPDINNCIDDYPPEEVVALAAKIEEHQTVQIENVATAIDLDDQTRTFLINAGITSKLMLPLQTRSGQRGAVVCNHYSGCHPWSQSEVELLKAVVDQLAIAIDQAELYAQTRAAALAAQTQAFHLREALQNLQQKEAQLIQSEKMSSLGQMVAGVAHEINNPVNFIYGNLTYCGDYVQDILQLLRLYQKYYPNPPEEVADKADDIDLDFIVEDLPKILSSMEMGAERIRQIVLSLRNFSRLDEAEKKPVNVHEGIDNTLLILDNRLKSKGKESGIEIVKEYSQLPKIECYAGQLNQVFMNIISNAIDALDNKPGDRIITIHTETIPANSSQPEGVQIRMKDNGPGMTEEIRNRLFDPFFTTKPVGKGTGLGLSISYQIVVEKHGGNIQCLSQPGEGSEFIIEIPIPKVRDSEA